VSKNTLTVEATNPALPIDALARSATKLRTPRYALAPPNWGHRPTFVRG